MYLPICKIINGLYVEFNKLGGDADRRLWVSLAGDDTDAIVPNNEEEYIEFVEHLNKIIVMPTQHKLSYFTGKDAPGTATTNFLLEEAGIVIMITSLIDDLTASDCGSDANNYDQDSLNMCDENLTSLSSMDGNEKAQDLLDKGGSRYILKRIVGSDEAINESDLLRPEWIKRWCSSVK